MKIIDANYQILTKFDGKELIKLAETYYYGVGKPITDEYAREIIKGFVRKRLVYPFAQMRLEVGFNCDKGSTSAFYGHFGLEAVKEAKYQKEFTKTGELTFIRPNFWEGTESDCHIWKDMMSTVEMTYNCMINNGASWQEANTLLPSSAKTKIAVSGTYLDWRRFFDIVLNDRAFENPQLEHLVGDLLRDLTDKLPDVFDDILLRFLQKRMNDIWANKGGD